MARHAPLVCGAAATSPLALAWAALVLAVVGVACDAVATALLARRKRSLRWPRRSTVVAVAVMVAAGLAALALGESPAHGVWTVALVALLLCVSLTDLEARVIPNSLVLCVVLLRACRIVAALATQGRPAALALFGGSVLGALAVAAPLAASAVVATYLMGESGMGGGDVKLLVALGLHVGWRHALVLLALACLLGIASAPLLAGRGANEAASGEKNTFPFGPAIALSCALVLAAQGANVGSYLPIRIGLFAILGL